MSFLKDSIKAGKSQDTLEVNDKPQGIYGTKCIQVLHNSNRLIVAGVCKRANKGQKCAPSSLLFV